MQVFLVVVMFHVHTNGLDVMGRRGADHWRCNLTVVVDKNGSDVGLGKYRDVDDDPINGAAKSNCH